MISRSLYLSLVAVAVASCSSARNNQASGDFDYANKSEPKAIVVPADLAKPDVKDDFTIISSDKVSGPIGNKVDVRAPSLVLPIATSSRVIPESSEAIIWFDKVLEEENLLEFITTAVKDQLIEDDVAIRTESEDGLSLETDWYHKEKESGVVITSIEQAESLRYRFDLAAKPHGRSVSLQVSLIEYMKTDPQGGTKVVDPIDQQRAEMAMLNQVTSLIDYKYRLQQRENRLMRANQKLVTIGENPEGEAAYIVEMESDLLWSNLPIFFEHHGFKIADLNETKKIYYVDFVKPDISLWDKIWGDDKPVIELQDQRYQFALSDISEQTALTIYRADGEVVSAELLEAIFPVMEPALSFRDL